MYKVNVEVKKSTIEGKGVFTSEDIRKGTITWMFDPTSDHALSVEEFDALDEKVREDLLRVAYLSPTTKRWVYPDKNDSASFTNHSKTNNQTVVFDESVSEEPFFRANRDIRAGEELTVDYGEFDERPAELLEEWVEK